MSGALLDTSVLIGSVGDGLSDLPTAAAISVVTMGELHAGVLLARDESSRGIRRARLDAVRKAFAPLVVDEHVAERYGEVLAVARRERRAANAADMLIIATAAAHNRTLHTRDRQQAELAHAADVAVERL